MFLNLARPVFTTSDTWDPVSTISAFPHTIFQLVTQNTTKGKWASRLWKSKFTSYFECIWELEISFWLFPTVTCGTWWHLSSSSWFTFHVLGVISGGNVIINFKDYGKPWICRFLCVILATLQGYIYLRLPRKPPCPFPDLALRNLSFSDFHREFPTIMWNTQCSY